MDNREGDKCPACGGDNACAIEADKAVGDCWCHDIAIPAEKLAALPESERGVRCFCKQCATNGSKTK